MKFTINERVCLRDSNLCGEVARVEVNIYAGVQYAVACDNGHFKANVPEEDLEAEKAI